jgi:hypothetical protein
MSTQKPKPVSRKKKTVPQKKVARKVSAKASAVIQLPTRSTSRQERIKRVLPDSIDLRDRPYTPAVKIIPAGELYPDVTLPVLDQGQTNACTGFALANLIFHLQHNAKHRDTQDGYAVSPYMLYSMARRYDEFPGRPGVDGGSSLRGAMKGWYKHGVCGARLWQGIDMPAETDPKNDWWQDSVKRPLGAYYRVDHRSVSDMQIALNEIGILYASAACHSGWQPEDQKYPTKTAADYFVIPTQKATPDDGGHAFIIVGYTSKGFIIQNSWAESWGTKGLAILTYQDWIQNAMDCWVAQLGVATELHEEIAAAPSLRLSPQGEVLLASDDTLRNREVDPFIVDMENNGILSNTGNFRTQPADVVSLVTTHLGIARNAWGLRDADPVDIAIYAHGGLTSEEGAAKTAASWTKALYDHQIFPIFLMWETDLWSTLKDKFEDLMHPESRTTGGPLEALGTWKNQRLERLLVVPGTEVWGEMKKNANQISAEKTNLPKGPDGNPDPRFQSGGVLLYQDALDSRFFSAPYKFRLHLIGHSAGAIVHTYIIDRLKDWEFETVNFMAPAVRVDLFKEIVLPAIGTRIKRYNQFHLIDDIEQKDPTCKMLLDYSRSLLYLVSQSFEEGLTTPILGMQKYFDQLIPASSNIHAFTSPGADSQSTTHGGFDDDCVTINRVVSIIKNSSVSAFKCALS